MRAARAGADRKSKVEKNLCRLSAATSAARIVRRMERTTQRDGRLIVTVESTTGEVARAIHALSDADLVRLGALARLWARGLPGHLGWSDVLHEAIARALDGSRHWPAGVPILAFLSGVMRSICVDHWRREQRESLLLVRDGVATDTYAAGDDARDPERMLATTQRLAAINRLFAGDAPALKVIAGLAEGLDADEICRRYAMSEREYDTTRKRMRRALLRRGLAWRDA
jgi:RNA polymerase sigma-70 factor (ECF subfamily)